MLTKSTVEANIPAHDLARARAFYEDTLGFTPSDEGVPGSVHYVAGPGTAFNVYETEFAGRAGHTIAQFHVDDLVAEVDELKRKGVGFEVYDLPGLEWDGEVATMPGMGKAAWFKDSEGNILCLDQDERGR
ncbi:VOC family protein [Cellulomonas endophytica]|uniref:VOC family protein n=1 Tax=Cellulomonas endophytica TaxID=2494735 RepID=UPI00101269A2|nr:VOC family protein [Cellulomonas endophytica]